MMLNLELCCQGSTGSRVLIAHASLPATSFWGAIRALPLALLLLPLLLLLRGPCAVR
jgi:hypothetical protein